MVSNIIIVSIGQMDLVPSPLGYSNRPHNSGWEDHKGKILFGVLSVISLGSLFLCHLTVKRYVLVNHFVSKQSDTLAALRIYAVCPLWPLRRRPNFMSTYCV